MKVVFANRMGFCHGVRKAYDTVMELGASDSAQSGEIVILGEIVHNEDVVARVERSGINTVKSPDGLVDKTVVLRTHGEERDRIEKLVSADNELVDCTCAIVKKVRLKALDLEKRHPAVVIVGKKNHPEIVGLVSWLANPHVVLTDDDIANLPMYKSVGIVGQTTLEPDKYAYAIALLEAKYGRWNAETETGAEWLKTICNHTVMNQSASVEVARQVDVMIVVGSPNSSNSSKLYDKCVAVNSNTIFIQRVGELDISRFTSQMAAGITSGASTPDWVVDEIVRKLETV